MKKTLVVFATLLTAAAASAQQCQPSDTALACWMRFNPAVGTDADGTTQAETDTQKTVTVANTGITSLVSPSGSAVEDFLSLLSASVESSSLTSNGQSLTLDYNPPVDILGLDHSLKLQAVFTKPELNAQLTTHFASDTAALTPFTSDLSSLDDIAISGTFQPTSDQYGRSIQPHRAMFRQMLNALAPTRSQWQLALAQAVAATSLTSETQTFSSLGADQDAAMNAIETAAKNQQTFLRAVGRYADAFARLLNNQPQVYGSAIYTARKNVVGPNEWSMKGTYELSTHNLNAFRRRNALTCNENTMATTATAAKCAQLLENFADAGAFDRLAMSVEYLRSNQRWISGDPNLQGFAFGYPRSHSFVYQLTYGRPLQGSTTTTSNGRIDVSFKYNDVRNPANASLDVQSEALGSITYTMKVNDQLSIPLSLIYANHASDLENVDKKLNAHFGLLYKFNTGK